MFGVYDPSFASGSEGLTQEDVPFDTNAAHAVWPHSSVSLGNLVSTAKSFHIPLSRDMISKKRLLQREHGTHSSKYSLMGKSKVRLTSTETASVCSDAPERFWASMIISLDQIVKLRQHTWASAWTRWWDRISIRRNQKATYFLSMQE